MREFLSRCDGLSTYLGLDFRRKRPSFSPHKRRKLSVEPLEARCLLSVMSVRVWDGSSLVDNHWTTPENWVGDVAPVAGDMLKFAGNVQTTTWNDFKPGTPFFLIHRRDPSPHVPAAEPHPMNT
jgi:hypothetical protein